MKYIVLAQAIFALAALAISINTAIATFGPKGWSIWVRNNTVLAGFISFGALVFIIAVILNIVIWKWNKSNPPPAQ